MTGVGYTFKSGITSKRIVIFGRVIVICVHTLRYVIFISMTGCIDLSEFLKSWQDCRQTLNNCKITSYLIDWVSVVVMTNVCLLDSDRKWMTTVEYFCAVLYCHYLWPHKISTWSVAKTCKQFLSDLNPPSQCRRELFDRRCHFLWSNCIT